ncbi:hypothetical protein QNO08_12130 [Arthrobacter sp. zg-Y820]|uniref:hypothetical protein n=1 Tax=Arthrobacter sp. zg-Y820 TaxID=2894192 RepID=UPI0024DF56FF|nr:hypothetical protein [Arthrobacter sp. zg-Y820]WIB11223.1 hypothetical protein QNO08_12130 [Arthrobacter sp. zg-Y820]
MHTRHRRRPDRPGVQRGLAQFCAKTGFYLFTAYGLSYPYFLYEEPKLSGKSPQGSNEKKPGKSIKDKRAEKRAKNSSDSELIPKKRKGQ